MRCSIDWHWMSESISAAVSAVLLSKLVRQYCRSRMREENCWLTCAAPFKSRHITQKESLIEGHGVPSAKNETNGEGKLASRRLEVTRLPTSSRNRLLSATSRSAVSRSNWLWLSLDWFHNFHSVGVV